MLCARKTTTQCSVRSLGVPTTRTAASTWAGAPPAANHLGSIASTATLAAAATSSMVPATAAASGMGGAACHRVHEHVSFVFANDNLKN